MSFGGKEHNGTAAEFPGGNFQTGIVDYDFRQRQLGFRGIAKGSEHLVADFLDQLHGIAGGERAYQHGAFPVDGEAAGRQAKQGRSGFGK